MRRGKKFPKSEQEWRPLREASRGWAVFSVVCHALITPASAWAGAHIGDPSNSPMFIAAVGLLMVGSTVSSILKIRSERKRDKENQKKFNEARALSDNFMPVIDSLADLLTSDCSDKDIKKFLNEILRAGGHLFQHESVRTCLYTLETIDDEDTEGSSKYLMLWGFAGRNDRPRNEFTPGKTAHDEAIKCAEGNQARCVPKIEDGDPTVDCIPERSAWKSFSQFPIVASNKKSLGSLMVDSIEEVEWSHLDMSLGNLVAHLLAFGLETLAEAAEDITPEVEDVNQNLSRLSNQLLDGKID